MPVLKGKRIWSTFLRVRGRKEVDKVKFQKGSSAQQMVLKTFPFNTLVLSWTAWLSYSQKNIEIGKITRIWKCERSNTQSQHTFFWNQFVLYFHFPDKETIYCNSGTSLSLTNNFVSLNGGAKGSHSAKWRLQDMYLVKLISLKMVKNNKSLFISQI